MYTKIPPQPCCAFHIQFYHQWYSVSNISSFQWAYLQTKSWT